MVTPPFPTNLNLHALQQPRLKLRIPNIRSCKPAVRGVELVWLESCPHFLDDRGCQRDHIGNRPLESVGGLAHRPGVRRVCGLFMW